jgi:hypothetical protein
MGEAKNRLRQIGEQHPIQEQYRQSMRAVAATLDMTFNGNATGKNRGTGFVLLVFPFESSEGRCNYISNGADRKDIIALMKEMIAGFEGQSRQEGNA